MFGPGHSSSVSTKVDLLRPGLAERSLRRQLNGGGLDNSLVLGDYAFKSRDEPSAEHNAIDSDNFHRWQSASSAEI